MPHLTVDGYGATNDLSGEVQFLAVKSCSSQRKIVANNNSDYNCLQPRLCFIWQLISLLRLTGFALYLCLGRFQRLGRPSSLKNQRRTCSF